MYPAGTAPLSNASGAGSPSSAESGALNDVWRVMRTRWLFIASFAVCVVIVAATVAYLLPRTYAASAEILLNQHSESKVADFQTTVTDTPDDPVVTQNQIRVLTSRELAAEVIERLGLAAEPEFGGDASQTPAPASGGTDDSGARLDVDDLKTGEDKAIDAFLAHLSVQPIGLSSAVSVTFTSRDPVTAAVATNAVADAFLAHEIDANSATARKAAAWLTDRVRKLKADMDAGDAAVQAYKSEHNLTEAADGTPLVVQEVLATQTQLVEARTNLAEKQAERMRLHALAASGNAAELGAVASSPVLVPLQKDYADLLSQEADLATKYGPKHPKLQAIQSQLKATQEKIDAEIGRTESAVDSDEDVARAQVQALEASLAETEHQASLDNEERVQLQSLQSNATSTRTAYETFVSRLREVQGQDAMQVPDATIISRAPVPTSPSSPPRGLIVAASLPAGLLLGLLVAMFQERGRSPANAPRASPKFREPEMRRVPVVGRVPDLGRLGLSPFSIVNSVVLEPASGFSRAIGELATRIFALPTNRGKVVGLSSPGAGDGKTVLAVSIARMAARRGWRVVLIDADPACRVGPTLRLPARRHGLSDVLASRAPLSRVLIKDPLSDLLVLSATPANAPSRGTLSSARMADLLVHLRHNCDLVVLDLPPQGGRQLPVTAPIDALLVVLGWNGAPVPADARTPAVLPQTPNIGLVLAA